MVARTRAKTTVAPENISEFSEDSLALTRSVGQSEKEILEQIKTQGYTDADEEPDYRTFRPSDISGYQGELYVKNLSDTQVCFDHKKSNGEHIILRLGRNLSQDHPAYGVHRDPSVALLSPDIARHPGFRKFWAKGKVEVTNDPRAEEELTALWEFELEEEMKARESGTYVEPRKTSLLSVPAPPNAPDNWRPGK